MAQKTNGSYTVGPGIDGWKGNEEPLRIDYVFASQEWAVNRLSVIFDGNNQSLVSDHYGLEAGPYIYIVTVTYHDLMRVKKHCQKINKRVN